MFAMLSRPLIQGFFYGPRRSVSDMRMTIYDISVLWLQAQRGAVFTLRDTGPRVRLNDTVVTIHGLTTPGEGISRGDVL